MMRAMIVLSVLASSMASPLPQSEAAAKWTGPAATTIPAGLPGAGNVVDTAEVAAAAKAFDAAVQAQLVAIGAITPQWTGPLATVVPAGLPNAGNVADTAEVAAASAAFQQAYSAALAATTGQRF